MNKKLGLLMAIALVVGNMVGSGIFLLPSSLAKYGSISLFAWIITSVGAIVIASTFSRLGTYSPKNGGPYAYCKEAYGEFMGFQVAYIYWIYAWVGNAAIAISFTGYFSFFIPAIAHSHIMSFVVSAAIVWILTIINIYGVRKSGVVQVVSVGVKLIPLVGIALIGLLYMHGGNFSQFNISHSSNFSALSNCVILTMWALTGVESASIPAAKIKNPRRTIALATIIGTSLSAVLYILSSISVMGIIPMNKLANSSAPFSQAAMSIFGWWGAIVIGLAALFSTLGALNGWILLQSQVPYAAAKDGLFPKLFSKTTKYDTPKNSLIITSLLITILLAISYNGSLVNQFTLIITLATIAILVVYLLTSGAEIIIYLKNNKKLSRREMIARIVGMVISMVYIFWAILGSGEDVVYYGFILIFSCC